MDPNETLARIIDAAVAGDRRRLAAAAVDLTNWLRNGGFAPDDPRPDTRSIIDAANAAGRP